MRCQNALFAPQMLEVGKFWGISVWQRDVMRAVSEAKHKEVALGVAMGGFTLREVDDIFGVGCWHALESFGVAQGLRPDGTAKIRPCDNAKASLHNLATALWERLVTETADFPARAASFYAELMGDSAFSFGLGTEDAVGHSLTKASDGGWG